MFDWSVLVRHYHEAHDLALERTHGIRPGKLELKMDRSLGCDRLPVLATSGATYCELAEARPELANAPSLCRGPLMLAVVTM